MSIFNRQVVIVALLTVLALGLRLWGISDMEAHTGDEAGQVSSAKHFIRTGHTDSTFWHHPPFGLILIAASIEVFGDNPAGWRLRNAVLGGMTPLLLFLIAAELFASQRVAFMAGLLLALDPLHIFLSRSTMDEIPAVFFFLLALLVDVKYLKGKIETPLASGLFLGLSLASKQYYALAILPLFIFNLVLPAKGEKAGWYKTMHVTLVFLLLPLVVFTACYFPWFAGGHGLRDFYRFQLDAYYDLQSMTYNWFALGELLRETGAPWEWFVRPKYTMLFGAGWGQWGCYLCLTNNPVIWLLTLPALFFMTLRYRKEKDRWLLMTVVLFLAVYVPLLLAKRPIFLYSATAVLPFAFLAVAYLVTSLAQKARMHELAYSICHRVRYCDRFIPLSVGDGEARAGRSLHPHSDRRGGDAESLARCRLKPFPTT